MFDGSKVETTLCPRDVAMSAREIPLFGVQFPSPIRLRSIEPFARAAMASGEWSFVLEVILLWRMICG